MKLEQYKDANRQPLFDTLKIKNIKLDPPKSIFLGIGLVKIKELNDVILQKNEEGYYETLPVALYTQVPNRKEYIRSFICFEFTIVFGTGENAGKQRFICYWNMSASMPTSNTAIASEWFSSDEDENTKVMLKNITIQQ